MPATESAAELTRSRAPDNTGATDDAVVGAGLVGELAAQLHQPLREIALVGEHSGGEVEGLVDQRGGIVAAVAVPARQPAGRDRARRGRGDRRPRLHDFGGGRLAPPDGLRELLVR